MKRSLFSIGPLFRNMRIKHKLFVLILFIMAFSYAMTYTVLQYAYSIYDEQLYGKSSQVLNLSSSSIENELRRIENLTFNIVTDPTIQTKLLEVMNTPSEYEQFKYREKTVERLAQFAGTEKYAISANLFDLEGYVYTGGRVPNWTEEMKKDIWDAANAASGGMAWVYPEDSDTGLLAVRLVRSYNSNLSLDLQTLGVVAIRVRLSQIAEDVLRGTEVGSGELQIAAGSRYIYPRGTSQTPWPLAATASQPGSGYEIKHINGHQVFVSRVNSPYTGWTYYSTIPFDTIFERIVWMKSMLVIVFSISLVVMIVIAMRVARNITVPIEGLIGRMKQVQKGDFTLADLQEPAPGTPLPKDEVGQLHRTFRIMIQQIDELITENYAKQLTIKDSQFKALQAQINPHFLYNTLESINWEAKVAGQQQISRMVESLGFLLRSSISQKQSIITVGQELDIIRHYLTIQMTRFEDRLVFEQDVSPLVYSCPIPKLTLQPLVENAIVHALEHMVDPCTISIRSYEREDGVMISVEDNGPGMFPEQLERVARGEVQSKGNGIGMSNIRDRLQLAFGEAYSLQIESEPGRGTRVSILIPYERSDS
ncbi:cache domain-containing sensor histidine kinase [Gorillibacterium sp. sgz5001074]|uniref:cache domain-containing sensor histidine kinase n=1 Tax=Gorillibacterium sp. sgz5001074 TaxID=3446695 RepID=UPI003F67A841